MTIGDREYEALVQAASKQSIRTTTWGASFAEAMARCQGAIETAQRDRAVKVESQKGSYTFRYATLASVMDVVREPLAANGLAVVQEPAVDAQRSAVTVKTTVMHSSGEYLQQALTLPAQRMDPQGLGAVISYARRYAILSILGVATDDDNEEHLGARKGAAVPPAPPRQAYVPPAVKTEAAPPPTDGPPPAEPEVPGPWQPSEADKMAARIREAQDVVTLKALSKEIATLPEHHKATLRKVYNARSKELTAGQAGVA